MRKYIGLLIVVLFGCHYTGGGQQSNQLKLLVKLSVDQDIYDLSDFGEPPQIAIWLENIEKKEIRTIWVSHRTGKNQWIGKVKSPLSLPYWEFRNRFEKSGFKERSGMRRLVDALTGATPKSRFSTYTIIEENSRWDCFIEVNVSGDFNLHFPSEMDDGTPDNEMNGQPSLIYKGHILGLSGYESFPQLIGRTDQWRPVNKIIYDLSGISSAKNIFKYLKVEVK